jgi:hypothetical protein
MSIQDNLNKRLAYMGGNAEGRMQMGKLRSLKKALLYSYQAATAVLQDKRQFRCLMNPSKNKADYTTNIISIPYEDVCLGMYGEDREPITEITSEGVQQIGMKPGDVFMWLETETYWLVTLEYMQEDAYFRAEVYRCDEQVEINGNSYWIAIKDPSQLGLEWHQKKGIIYNSLNYSRILYVTKNEETSAFFHRHQKLKINGNNWKVSGVSPYYGDNIIEVALEEDFNNSVADEVAVEEKPEPEISLIEGPDEVNPYDTVKYSIAENNGIWKVDTNKVRLSAENNCVTIDILTGKSGEFKLSYYVDGNEYAYKHITIKSL